MAGLERRHEYMVQHNITAIVIALGALLLLALVVVAYLFLRTRRIELECELLIRGSEGTNFVEIVNDNIDQVHGLLEEMEALSERYAAVLRRVAGAVQHVGVVRFDAFRDLGGLLSFAVALLDDRGNGLIFSSIYGRSESRTYAKPIIERSSSYELSPEEREAIRLAMQSKEMGALPVEAKDREHEERMANLRLFHDREYLSRSPEARAEAEARIREERLDVEQRPPARRPAQQQEEPARQPMRTRDGAAEPSATQSRRRKVGRASHIGPVERKPEQEAAPAAPTGGRSLDEQVQKLLEPADDAPVEAEPRRTERRLESGPERPERTSRPRTPEKAGDRSTPQKRPAEPRPRGLDTPVERLRNKEQD